MNQELQSQDNRIVAAVLTLNEATNLKRCLSSLGRFYRCVVLDSGSIDGTVDVARRLGAEVLENQQSGPFNIAEQRNWLLRHDSIEPGTWVLFLDADEVVTEACFDAIVSTTRNARFGAYELTPQYLFEGAWMKHSMGYPNWHPRLVQKGKAQFAGGVWEHFDTRRVGRVYEPYVHYGNSKGFSDWIERHQRYSAWESRRVYDYLQTRQVAAFGTQRALGKRALAARFWRMRPIIRFVWMYFWRRGFLDGGPALKFCVRYALYEYMIVENVSELRRLAHGQEL